jgi:hypothetical protein
MATYQVLEVAEQFLKLWSQKDYQRSRAHLADELKRWRSILYLSLY